MCLPWEGAGSAGEQAKPLGVLLLVVSLLCEQLRAIVGSRLCEGVGGRIQRSCRESSGALTCFGGPCQYNDLTLKSSGVGFQVEDCGLQAHLNVRKPRRQSSEFRSEVKGDEHQNSSAPNKEE